MDIETTGFIGGRSYPTVVGIAVDFPGDWSTTQLVGNGITTDAVLHVLEGVTTIYTFNGASFDLPFLAWKPGVDLRRRFEHRDLMRESRRAGLKGWAESHRKGPGHRAEPAGHGRPRRGAALGQIPS